MSNSTDHLRPENEPQTEDPDDDWNLSIADVCTVDVIEDEAAAPCMIKPEKNDVEQITIGDPPEASDIITLPTEVSVEEPERTFQCSDCAFRSNSGGEMETSLHTAIFEIFVLFLVSIQWLMERYHSIRRYVQASH
jgi:hypothetical protein